MARIPKGRACSLHSQLRGQAAETVDILMCVFICPFLQARSHFGVAMVQAWADCKVLQGTSHSGWMPVKGGRLDRKDHRGMPG